MRKAGPTYVAMCTTSRMPNPAISCRTLAFAADRNDERRTLTQTGWPPLSGKARHSLNQPCCHHTGGITWDDGTWWNLVWRNQTGDEEADDAGILPQATTARLRRTRKDR